LTKKSSSEKLATQTETAGAGQAEESAAASAEEKPCESSRFLAGPADAAKIEANAAGGIEEEHQSAEMRLSVAASSVVEATPSPAKKASSSARAAQTGATGVLSPLVAEGESSISSNLY